MSALPVYWSASLERETCHTRVTAPLRCSEESRSGSGAALAAQHLLLLLVVVVVLVVLVVVVLFVRMSPLSACPPQLPAVSLSVSVYTVPPTLFPRKLM